MAGEDPQYVSDVHELLCCVRALDPCDGPIEAHHAGPRGLGQRAHDRTSIPLCRKHHRAWHDLAIPFASMSREERRAFIDRQIARTQETIDHAAAPIPPSTSPRIRIGVDVQVGGRACAALDAAGFDVVVRALPGEADVAWFNRAMDQKAELVVSPDHGFERLCRDAAALCDIQWVKLWPRDGWQRQVERVAAARGRALRAR